MDSHRWSQYIFFGWTIWIISLPFVRQKTSSCPTILITFTSFSSSSLPFMLAIFFFNMAAGGIFLFKIVRFLRFCQSKKSVNVIWTRCLPGVLVELVLSKLASYFVWQRICFLLFYKSFNFGVLMGSDALLLVSSHLNIFFWFAHLGLQH